MTIHVHQPGALTTVQDLGRPGMRALGVGPSGPFDVLSFLAANRLAGNDDGAAVLEITIAGPELVFGDAAVVAIAGASVETTVDGQPVANGAAFRVAAGRRLSFGRMTAGARCYLAVRGGIQVPLVLGSRSTHVAAGLGGAHGRKVATGDPLNVGRPADGPLRRLRGGALPAFTDEATVRAIRGPQDDAFTADGLRALFGERFAVSPRSDRTGVRLDGPGVAHASDSELDPEPLVAGAIQVPADGGPIVLGPDGPATGGYAKVATVITADLPVIAQRRPGDAIRFVETSVEQARAAWLERERALAAGIEDR